MFRYRLVVFNSVFTIAAICVSAQSQPPPDRIATLALTAPLPIDPAWIVGKLPNELTYYIRPVPGIKEAQLRLVVKAGSLVEEDDQMGMASFLFDLAMTGTEHFSKQEVEELTKPLSTPAAFYPRTNYDETLYGLSVASGNEAGFNRALRLLADWARGPAIAPAEVERLRLARLKALEGRPATSGRPDPYKGSRRASRPVGGRKETFEDFKLERLKQFIADWYRPDVMAVVAVGDFDVAGVEESVKGHFGALAAPTSPTAKRDYPVPDLSEPHVSLLLSKDFPIPEVSLMISESAPQRRPTTIGDYRGYVVDALACALLAGRLADVNRRPDSPFNDSTLLAPYVRPMQSASQSEFVMSFGVKEGHVERALELVLTETLRAARFGFTPGELDRQKRQLLIDRERTAAPAQPARARPFPMLLLSDMRRLGDQAQTHFVASQPIPSPADEAALYRRLLPGITVEDVSAVARRWNGPSRRISVFGRTGDPALAPDEAKLAAVVKSVSGRALKPYVEAGDAESLLSPAATPISPASAQLLDRAKPADTVIAQPGADTEAALAETAAWLEKVATPVGSVTRTETKPFGIIEWQLSNGARVVLKPTLLHGDEVVVRAFSPGGTSLADDQDVSAARVAVRLVTESGFGTLTRRDLANFLTGKAVSLSPYINERDEGMTGSTSKANLETLFQLIYLAFTQPRADAGLEVLIADRLRTESRASDFSLFSETLNEVITQNHPRARPLTSAILRQVDVTKALAFYKSRFADASDFTFLFVGNFEPARLQPLVERYVASLPSLRRGPEVPREIGIRPPKGVVERRVEWANPRRGQFALAFSGPFTHDQDSRIAIRALAFALEARVRKSIEDWLSPTQLGLLDAVTPAYTQVSGTYRLTIQFECPPERVEEAVKVAFDHINQLKTTGPTDADVRQARDRLMSEYQANSQRNIYFRDQIALRYSAGEDLTSLFSLDEYYKKLTPEIIHAAARQYFDLNNYVKVTLVPEKKVP